MKILEKIKIVLLLAICLLSFAAINAYGAEFDNIKVENDILSGSVHVSGETDNIYQISLCVTDNNISSMTYTESIFENRTYAFGQVETTEKDGKILFECDLKMPTKLQSGTYRVFIYADDRDGIHKDFTFSNRIKAESGYEILNTATNLEDLVNGFDLYREDLNFESYFYNNFSKEQKEKLSELFFKNRPTNGYKNLEDMRYSFGVLSLIVTVGSQSDTQIMDKYICEKGGLYGDISIYTSCEDNVRLSVCNGLINTYYDPSTFFNSITDNSVVKSFKLATVWNDYPDKISYYDKYFVLTKEQQDKLNVVANKKAIYQDMYLAKNSYNTTEDILSKYVELIDKYYNKEFSKQDKPSGGSSGGGVSVGLPFGNNTDVITPEQPSEVFDDINNALWAKEAILSLYNKNIISGSTDGYFHPNNNIKREEFVKMIAVSFNLEKSTELSFSDVPDDAWYRKYLALAYGEQIIYGVDENRFGAGMYLTRQDLTVIIYRAMQLRNVEFKDKKIDFLDSAEIADYAYEAIGRVAGLGIINGMPDGTFRPNEYATRAQTAQILNMVLNIMK